ncbi:MAG: hypothetical protein ACOZQL_19345 [Myxococcota bacterium]
MQRQLVLALTLCAGCTPWQRPPLASDNDSARVVFQSLEHLETRTTLSSADFFFKSFPQGLDAESLVANLAPEVHVDAQNGHPVNASIELVSSHYGDGFRVSWDRGLPDGWYRIVIPTKQLPALINAKAWSQVGDEASVWFRVGSQPLVRSIGRLRGDASTFFELHFSEVLRAETTTLDDLVRLFDGDVRLSCTGVAAQGANAPVDLTRHFQSFALKCEGANLNATRVEVSRFTTPEGTLVADVTGGGASFSIDWQTAVPLEGGLSEQWYESRLPR